MAKKKPAKKNGRPTKYKAEFAEQVYRLCLMGLTDKELIVFFEVSVRTWNYWKKQYPEFLHSIKKGKEIADGDVTAKLYERATGYEHPDTHISNFQGEITKTEIIKHYPPDPTSMIFWLKNRQRKHWRDRVDNTHSDPDGGPIRTITRTIIDPKEKG